MGRVYYEASSMGNTDINVMKIFYTVALMFGVVDPDM